MEINELFGFLIKDYGLSYEYQRFENCFGGNWIVITHSFYNNSGCFTIHSTLQREMDFYYSTKFSTDRDVLCERGVDITTIEPEIWKKHSKIWIFERPFFWCSDKRVLNALAEALKVHLEKNNDFFGIQVKRESLK